MTIHDAIEAAEFTPKRRRSFSQLLGLLCLYYPDSDCRASFCDLVGVFDRLFPVSRIARSPRHAGHMREVKRGHVFNPSSGDASVADLFDSIPLLTELTARDLPLDSESIALLQLQMIVDPSHSTNQSSPAAVPAVAAPAVPIAGASTSESSASVKGHAAKNKSKHKLSKAVVSGHIMEESTAAAAPAATTGAEPLAEHTPAVEKSAPIASVSVPASAVLPPAAPVTAAAVSPVPASSPTATPGSPSNTAATSAFLSVSAPADRKTTAPVPAGPVRLTKAAITKRAQSVVVPPAAVNGSVFTVVPQMIPAQKQAEHKPSVIERFESQWRMCGNRNWTLYSKSFQQCEGTYPFMRGYPCGLWLMLHSLIARLPESLDQQTLNPAAYLDSKTKTIATDALLGIRDYVHTFFGCIECRNHFYKITRGLEFQVRTRRDAVLYLWHIHNSVNRRAARLEKEHMDADPLFPKVTAGAPCARCFSTDC